MRWTPEQLFQHEQKSKIKSIVKKRERAKKKPLSGSTEKEIQDSIIKVLGLHNIDTWNVNRMDMATTCRVGFPDITFCFLGRYIAFEVKRPGKQLRANQAAWMGKILRAGGRHFVVHSGHECSGIIDKLKAEFSK